MTHSEGREDQATACIKAALESGITTFDTADVYADGGAETILGDAVAGERRESLEILTKVFGAMRPYGPNDSGLSRKHIHESINASLTRLRTDYVDPKYNALYRVIEPEVVPTCKELGIGQICFSPIEQGILTGRYQPGQPVPDGSRATDPHGATFIKGLLTDDLLTRIQKLAPLAQAEGLTVAQLAVAWVVTNDNVASAITGGSRPEQVKDNAAAAGKKLTSETLAAIDEALGDTVERDGSLVGSMSPTQRPT